VHPFSLLLLIPACFFTIQAFGASLPEENAGIVSKHPNDKGTAADPSVLFAEYFSEKGLDVFLERRESTDDPTNLSLSIESPGKIESKQSLLITQEGGRATGSPLYRRLPSRLQQIFARWYVRIDSDC
jgi:hypothetical protein